MALYWQLTIVSLLALPVDVLTSPSISGNSNKNVENEETFIPLVPQQSCYYESFSKRLACVCKNMDMAASLDLRVGYFVYNSGNEIREVQLRQCRRLSVRLDLTGVDATNIPIHFQAIQRLDIDSIIFEPQFHNRQELELNFNNVQIMNLVGLNIDETLKLKAVNVKEARFINMTFAHIPVNGFEISRARLVEIRDSLFSRVSPRSVIVEKSEKVNVAYNEMTINAFEAVYATDGSHLHISCNRILRRPISPDCSRTTTTTTTTTTTSTTPIPPPMVRNMDYDGPLGSKGRREEDTSGGISGEMIGGIVVGILVVVAIVLLFILVSRRRQQDKPVDTVKNAELDERVEKGNNVPGTSEEKEALLPVEIVVPAATSENGENRSDNEEEDVELRPKFASPIWIEEIQKNKIFNRQKSLLSEESIKDLANGQPHLAEVEEETVAEPLSVPEPLSETGLLSADAPTPPPPLQEDDELPPPPAVVTETRENSKTESDEDSGEPQKQQLQPQVDVEVADPENVKVAKPKVFETDI